jgi:hypothetical protein
LENRICEGTPENDEQWSLWTREVEQIAGRGKYNMGYEKENSGTLEEGLMSGGSSKSTNSITMGHALVCRS